MALSRWILFLFIGLPIQFVIYLIYPFIVLYWRLFIFKSVDKKQSGSEEPYPIEWRHSDMRNGCFHKNEDDHNMFTHFGLFNENALLLTSTENGELYRMYSDKRVNLRDISGDCLVFWAFAATLIDNPSDKLKERIIKVADNYLKYLGCLSLQGEAMNAVSARCNNFGINYCPDAYKSIGQPAFGPQYYTSASIFALASKYSLKYKIVFWCHWILLGGWYWQFVPMVYSRNYKLGYVRDVTMRSLYVIKYSLGEKNWVKRPMKFITEIIAEWHNPLFLAISGSKNATDNCPRVFSPWWLQSAEYVDPSNLRDYLENIYMFYGIKKIENRNKGE